MEQMTKENLVELLRHEILDIEFTKVDGTERVMKCTLLPEYVPNAPMNNGKVLLQEGKGSDNISVWDTESNGWRSFRINSVKNISMG